jgi:hypothetical protein
VPRPSGRLAAAAILTVGLIASAVGRPAAWGPDGHRIVARIALAHLTPQARQQVDRILSGDALRS